MNQFLQHSDTGPVPRGTLSVAGQHPPKRNTRALGRAACAVAICCCGPVWADSAALKACTASHVMADELTACAQFLERFQQEKGWRCTTEDWSEYLNTHVPVEVVHRMGGLEPVLEETAVAFCDRGHTDN